jgi:hypothetical protein
MEGRSLSPLFLAALVAGCGPNAKSGVSPDSGAEDGTADARSSFEEDAGECNDVIDVVFVLDVSSSMGFVLDKLKSEIGSVVTAANELAPDAHFGLIAFADNFALDASGPREGGLVHVEAATLQTAFQMYKDIYTAHNRNPGDGPGGPTTQNPLCEENSLDSLHAAAAQFPWRDSATRVIIVATDDTFLERPDNYGDRDGDGKTDKTDFPREGDYPALRTVAETVEALKQAKARVFSFTLLQPPLFPELTQCGTPRRLPWSAISRGWSAPYGGADPIPDQTDGKNFDLNQVKNNQLSLSATINDVVLESYCVPPIL